MPIVNEYHKILLQQTDLDPCTSSLPYLILGLNLEVSPAKI